jgi:ATP-dependent helicase/nuclease subunit A
MRFRPSDEDARERARTDFRTSLVLEAGAGTGKTTLLVDRILALVQTGACRLDQIAAVTFTENAATTMKLRIREGLEKARAAASAPVAERARASAALDVLERAPISTIHALCTSILQERPLECGVLPGFRVADEAEADILFAEAWDEWLADRLVSGDEVLLEAMEQEISLEPKGRNDERTSLRGLARTLLDQRDLAPLLADAHLDVESWKRELEENGKRAAELSHGVAEGDTLAARLLQLAAFAEQARFLSGPALEAQLLSLPTIQKNFGHKARWPSAEALDAGRAIAAWTGEAKAHWTAAKGADLHGRLVRALLDVVRRYESKKTQRGVLDFVDLLVKARDALRDRESVRRHFRDRFRVLLIDEFQDTDPLQVEIALALSQGVPGGLVVVGDAKQSIYRFRRAEVGLFRKVSDEAAREPGRAVLHLTQNFRSRPAILRFVNHVFAALIVRSEEGGQPGYEPIDPPSGLSEEPAVVALRFDAPFAEGVELLAYEAAATAKLIARAAAGGYEVRDLVSKATRASRAGDVLVLSRRLTQMRFLEEALEKCGLPFTVEGGKSFFDRQEVHEVLAVLRAADDPTDRVSLVAALRSSFFGVSDREIVSYALAGGRLRIGPVDEDAPGAAAVGPALALLVELNRLRTRLSVPALIDRLYDQTRVLAALTGTRRGEAQIANLEKVAALARQAGELGVLTLRGFTRLLSERIGTAREEPDLPSTRPGDPATVRILSIHKAKGLEAPIVALYDSADDLWLQTNVISLWAEGKVAVGFKEGCRPPRWKELADAERARAFSESRRLLYVACTRARDWLVVPQPPKDARVGSFWRDLVAALPAASDADVTVLDAATLPTVEREDDTPDLRALAAAEGGDAVAARWEADRRALLDAGSHRPFTPVSAGRVAARTAPPPVLVASGGEGRGFGSLVHRLLERAPTDALHPERVQALAVALAPGFGLDVDAARRAAETVLAALRLPVMERARMATRAWRELPLWFADGGELVEGVVDLVFEEDGGLVVVDYKTDHIAPEQALAQAAHHAPQLQLYGRGLAQASGLPVRERLVLFTALGQTVPV